MAVTVELKLDTDTLREQMREIIAELREEMACPCTKRYGYTDYIEDIRYTIDDVFAMRDEAWANR